MRYYLTDDILPVVPFCLEMKTYNLFPNQKCGEVHIDNFKQNRNFDEMEAGYEN